MHPQAVTMAPYLADSLDDIEKSGKTPTEALLELAKRIDHARPGYGLRVQVLGYLTVVSGARSKLGWSALHALIDEVQDATPSGRQVEEDFQAGVRYAMEKVVAIGA